VQNSVEHHMFKLIVKDFVSTVFKIATKIYPGFQPYEATIHVNNGENLAIMDRPSHLHHNWLWNDHATVVACYTPQQGIMTKPMRLSGGSWTISSASLAQASTSSLAVTWTVAKVTPEQGTSDSTVEKDLACATKKDPAYRTLQKCTISHWPKPTSRSQIDTSRLPVDSSRRPTTPNEHQCDTVG